MLYLVSWSDILLIKGM